MQALQHLKYEKMIAEVLSTAVPNAYTTIKTKQQQEKTYLRTRTEKACYLPRGHGPVDRQGAQRDLESVPFRFV